MSLLSLRNIIANNQDASAAGRNLFGVFLIVLSLTIIPFGDGIAKLLGEQGYPAIQITWARYSVHLFITFFLVLKFSGRKGLVPNNLPIQLVRCVLVVFATVCFFTSLQFLPLADAIAIVFIAPLVMTILSGPLLGERVGIWRWSSVVVGFVGVLIIIRPGGDSFIWESLWALVAAIGFGLYVVLTRKASGQNTPLVSLFFMGFIGAIILSFIVPFQWVPPKSEDWMLFLTVGLCATLGHGLLIWATDFIEASIIAPLHYVEIIGAVIIGYWLFGDLPDFYTIVGCGIVVVAGLVIIYRERRGQQSKP